jgi:hypothetical protein
VKLELKELDGNVSIKRKREREKGINLEGDKERNGSREKERKIKNAVKFFLSFLLNIHLPVLLYPSLHLLFLPLF